ncbi:hypothetical protein NESM_000269100 [Novymonas esmeraldas]|uniref:Secreted protein n=1 Tax=Novymonas esmeraldas TaxID=1808958 RepID=A0AAW0FBG5_9TRYP
MSVFKTLIVAVCVLALLVSNVAEEDGVEALPGLLLHFGADSLKSRFGSARTFNHSETRQLYNMLLSEAEKAIQDSREDAGRRAYTCSKIRWQARRYARSRDGTYAGPWTEIVLQLRDSYVHGIRHLPMALRQDVSDSMALQRPTLYRTAVVVKQAYFCLAPTLSGGECPSYAFLRIVRGKADADIIESCTRSNKSYNDL